MRKEINDERRTVNPVACVVVPEVVFALCWKANVVVLDVD